MAMMAPETVSNVNGYTFNSLNNKLTCGGSSGGEGALIAAGGSPMGFGTDLGGSIRIPASFQGLYALKPSTNRFSYLRISNSYSGQGAIPSVVGPMARSLQDIEYIAKLVLNGGLWETDPKVLPIPFREIEMSKLVIGIWKFDGKILPHPPLLRALHETSAALKAHGHEVVEIDFPSLQIIEVADRVYKADEGREVFEECKVSGEPIVPAVKPLITSTPGHQPLSVNEWWDVDNQSYVCKQQFLKFWSETAGLTNSGRPIDAIICPVWPSGAFLPGGPAAMNYSCPFNLLESPCAVLPVATASKTLDPVNTGYVPFDETDMLIQKAYDPELQDGLPVCLQVVGKKLDDEKVLAIASVVKSCLVADRGRF
ncbi:amidase signature enzyme [Yamadazyma tenuis ATCC 10573]|nr:amidase signature enzyme [Yamadazyma tenuis ATCC 10573]EGV64005.1 amidase signature enzyme [Yamadazyma tenuis ATCC 10573]